MKKKTLVLFCLLVIVCMFSLGACSNSEEVADYSDIGTKVESYEQAMEVIRSLDQRSNFVMKTTKVMLQYNSAHMYEYSESAYRVSSNTAGTINGQAADSQNKECYIQNEDKVDRWTWQENEAPNVFSTEYSSISKVISEKSPHLTKIAELKENCIRANWDETSKKFIIENENSAAVCSVEVYTGGVALVNSIVPGSMEETLTFCGFDQVKINPPQLTLLQKIMLWLNIE